MENNLNKKIDRNHITISAQIWLVGSMVTQNIVASFLMLGLGLGLLIYSRIIHRTKCGDTLTQQHSPGTSPEEGQVSTEYEGAYGDMEKQK